MPTIGSLNTQPYAPVYRRHGHVAFFQKENNNYHRPVRSVMFHGQCWVPIGNRELLDPNEVYEELVWTPDGVRL